MYPSYDEWYERIALALRQSDIPSEYVEKFLADRVMMHKHYRDNAHALEVLQCCFQDYRADESAPTPTPPVTLKSFVGAAVFIAGVVVGVVVLVWISHGTYVLARVGYVWLFMVVPRTQLFHDVLPWVILCAIACLIVVVARLGGRLAQPRK